jgi:hypothetical protein
MFVLEIPSVFTSRATVDATFVPWLWASVNIGAFAEIISDIEADLPSRGQPHPPLLRALISVVNLTREDWPIVSD